MGIIKDTEHEVARDAANKGAEESGIKQFVGAEAVPGAELAQQPDATGAVQEEAVREQELKMMALRLDTAYEQLEAKKRAHDAAMQQVPLCG